jgi:hypothetical protein
MNEIIKNLISTGAITAVIIFLGQKVVELQYSKELEKFKAELSRQITEFNIRFKLLHTKRASVVKTIYQKLVQADDAIYSLTKPLQMTGENPQNIKAKKAVESINDLISYYEMNKLYLDGSNENRMDKIIKLCKKTWINFDTANNLKKSNDKQYARMSKDEWKEYEIESAALKKEIRKEFRSIIGIKK